MVVGVVNVVVRRGGGGHASQDAENDIIVYDVNPDLNVALPLSVKAVTIKKQ